MGLELKKRLNVIEYLNGENEDIDDDGFDPSDYDNPDDPFLRPGNLLR
jgi:hypothetical protein